MTCPRCGRRMSALPAGPDDHEHYLCVACGTQVDAPRLNLVAIDHWWKTVKASNE